MEKESEKEKEREKMQAEEETSFLGEVRREKVSITRSYIKLSPSYMRLYYTVVAPNVEGSPRGRAVNASLLMFHGLQEDSSSYLDMATQIASSGNYECHLVDLRGFGYSTGVRGYADLLEFQTDMVAVINEVAKRNQTRGMGGPTFVYAHSYAANAILTLLINNPQLPLAGVVLASPAFSAHPQYSKLSLAEKVLYLYVHPQVHV